jgi:predicted ABC-type transport system involved in lysophospholipase L1 biosynthesis ATPase subunit
VFGIFERIVREGGSRMVAVTHDRDMVVCTERRIHLRNGRIVD